MTTPADPQPTPHITELLDLTSVLELAVRAIVADMLSDGVEATPTEEGITGAIESMRVVDLGRLRTYALGVVYPTARAIAEQAWARGYASGTSRAMRRMSDEPDVEDATNPFAEGEVLT